MVTISATEYKSKGKNTRVISCKGKKCLSMPRKDSTITILADVKPMSMYKVTLMACLAGSGNGSVVVEFSGPGYTEQSFQTYVKSKDFRPYSFNIPIDDVVPEMSLVVSRPYKTSGNILIEAISYEEVERPESDIELAAALRAYESNTAIEKVVALREQTARKMEAHLVVKGKKTGTPIRIGGKGYRWRGKNIRTVSNFGSVCVYMSSRESTVVVPIKIVSEAKYKVTVTAARVDGSGNGIMMVNLFGGQRFDGSHAQINVSSGKLQQYIVNISSPKFPSNLPMNLRFWRPSNGSGTVCIKDIEFVQISGKIIPNTPRKPKSNKVRAIRTKKSRNHTIISTPLKTPKENNEMKFRPYKASSIGNIKKVLINSADQVPKVSIITPTRDGVELLKNCYKALNENTGYPNWEWIVGDSNSQDSTVEFIKGLKDPRVKLIERGTTEGSFSSINNELVKHADGEYYLFLNDDTEPGPLWLYEMMSKIHRHPEIGVVGARLEYVDGKIQHAGVAFIPEGPANLGKAALKQFAPKFHEHDRFYQAVTAACLLMRKKDFNAVNGFDPIYHFCYEDIDLCLKVRYQLNKKVLYAANAKVKHLESVTQKRHRTSGDKQQVGIKEFKKRWGHRAEKDFVKYMKQADRNIYKVDVSFVTCVNNLSQYIRLVVGSLFMNNTGCNYEIIPIMNFGNPYSAASALNLGISKARGKIIVLCHQDVLFYENWVDTMFERINKIEQSCPEWGVLGTAGITTKDVTVGVVYNLRGKMQWSSTRKAVVSQVQTVDEHCMIIRKNSKLRFDDKRLNGFHLYGAEICLMALSRGMRNYGIVCPLTHSGKSGSLASGKKEFMRLLNVLANKWRKKFPIIRTPTSVIRRNRVITYIKFKNE